VADLGANIVSVVTYESLTEGERCITFKLNDVDGAVVKQALEKLGLKVTDFRTM
jgi:hypothetical protein